MTLSFHLHFTFAAHSRNFTNFESKRMNEHVSRPPSYDAAFSSGQIADALLTRGWERWKVRRLMMNVATVGPCVALLVLPAAQSTAAAVGLLAVMLGTQAVSIAGYHSYLQDVAPSRAGAFLGGGQSVASTCVSFISSLQFAGR